MSQADIAKKYELIRRNPWIRVILLERHSDPFRIEDPRILDEGMDDAKMFLDLFTSELFRELVIPLMMSYIIVYRDASFITFLNASLSHDQKMEHSYTFRSNINFYAIQESSKSWTRYISKINHTERRQNRSSQSTIERPFAHGQETYGIDFIADS